MNNQIGFLRKFRTNFASFQEVWLFTQIFLLVTALPIMLRLLSLPKLMNLITPQDMTCHKDMDLDRLKDKVAKFTDYVLSQNFWIYKHSCLKRSLVLYHFLRRLGIKVHICFGVKYNQSFPEKGVNKKIEGHSWLVYKGKMFLENKANITRTYKITYSFPDDKTIMK
jgi:hypothetical protein